MLLINHVFSSDLQSKIFDDFFNYFVKYEKNIDILEQHRLYIVAIFFTIIGLFSKI
jgi:hypothetical protein